MSSVRHLDEDNVTVLDAWDNAVVFDCLGVAVIVQVEQHPAETSMSQIHVLRCELEEAIGDFRQFYYTKPNEADAKRCRQHLKASLQPFLEAVVLEQRSARRNTLHHLALATCMYDNVLDYKIQQTDDGKVYLEKFEFQRACEPLTFDVGLDMQLELPQYETHKLAIESDSISLNRIQATVVFAEQQEDTCLARYTVMALRDLSMSSLQPDKANTASWMHTTLTIMSQVNKFRATMSPELRERLRVPRLVGLVYHVWNRGSTVDRPLVGGLLEHVEAASSWDDLRRRDQPPSKELQRRWAGQIRDTILMLHDMGLAWGGTAGHDMPENMLMASVDIDANDQPWLVRNFGGTAGRRAQYIDRTAVKCIILLADALSL